MKIGIIGCGAIGQLLCALIPRNLPEVQISAVVERAELHDQLRARLDPNTRIETSVSALLDIGLDLVIECAGHAALKSTGPTVLKHGTDLLVVSVGALADRDTEAALMSAATFGRSKLRIPAGALGGLDALGAAKLVGLERVLYLSNKAPLAWKGTPAESMIALDDVTKTTVFFSGTAREAAQLFPQNANVAAAVALAGIGFDKTMVSLSADPDVAGNTHRIEAVGLFGEVSVRIVGKPLAGNPKTSMLAPYSVVRSLANMSQTIVIA
ncbi:L-aspartate dehydrogenase (plasmid) [Caballeronia sp. SBC1]|uniref:aspartate dehydrogenase n=1 Tax=unclassified Caballeronia TaxID=2646786 RepID=UPI0013E12700|nr:MULTISPECIES: aspartate dehydrogenase [unclassified Caballeronia]QIE27200.1 L-aspartate dehydrogenase [Caballeronia sp. SBC2]QIN65321.1 L-aspartate dehydrogenase [Caballeronia sp. SBC1]